MIDVEVSSGEIRAVDVEKNEVTIRVDGWEPTDTAARLDRRVDKAISGVTGGFEFPLSSVTIESLGDDSWTVKGILDSHSLPAEPHVIQFEHDIGVFVATDSSCRIYKSQIDGHVNLEFDTPTKVTLGFRSRVSRPRHTITVPQTLDGFASAVRYLSSSIETNTADRSYPSLRAHPPLIELGSKIEIPEQVYRDTSFSELTLTTPRSVGKLLVTAPLIYYLKTDVKFDEHGPIEIDGPTLEDSVILGENKPLESHVADLLHRIFYLDCVVRNGGPYSVKFQEFYQINQNEFDIEKLYTSSISEQLSAYLEFNFEQVKSNFPKWHLSTAVDPILNNIRILPHLLDRMSLVQVPEPVILNKPSIVAESVQEADDPAFQLRGTVGNNEFVKNNRQLARFQGWNAEGIPVDAFRTSIDAFENRIRFHQSSSDIKTVLVVINEDSMFEEQSAVEEVYRRRAVEMSIDVSVEQGLHREQLFDRLESEIDFLHFIGHCDDSGIRCPDGVLSISSIDETGIRTFFLNACSSFHEGLSLIRKGSIAGAVTLHDILNPQATRVGLIFAQLVMHGYNVSIALKLALTGSLMNKFYSVVGDGTYRLVQGANSPPSINIISKSEEIGNYLYEIHTIPLSDPGGVFQPHPNGDTPLTLFGNKAVIELPVDDLISVWDTYQEPVFYEGKYYWSSELKEKLSE